MSIFRQFDEILDDNDRAEAMRLYQERVKPDMDLDDKIELREDIIRFYDQPASAYD